MSEAAALLPPRVEVFADRALFVVEGQPPRLIAHIRTVEDGRLLVIPDRANLGRAVTALRATPEEVRAYLEPLALAAQEREPEAEPPTEPDLFATP